MYCFEWFVQCSPIPQQPYKVGDGMTHITENETKKERI